MQVTWSNPIKSRIEYEVNEGYLQKLLTNIKLNGEGVSYFFLRSGIRQRCPLLPFLFKIVPEVILKGTN